MADAEGLKKAMEEAGVGVADYSITTNGEVLYVDATGTLEE